MASQWLRWNITSHIFEYSTDNGTSFIPLPLDASILNQGTLSPSVIPAGGISLSGNNTWTGINMYSGIFPSIRFNETDQGVNLKNWDIVVENANLSFRTLSDALGVTASLMSLDRAGQLALTATGGADHSITANFDGHCLLNFQNNSAGASPTLGLSFRNNIGLQGYVIFTGSNNSNSAFVPDALNLYSSSAGGLNISSINSIVLKTNFTTRLSVALSGAITISGPTTINNTLNLTGNLTGTNVTASVGMSSGGGYYELGRGIILGGFTSIPFVATDFSGSGSMVWTVASGNIVNWGYTIVGKQVTVHYDIANSTITGTPAAFLNLKLPAALSAIVGCFMPCWISNPAGSLGMAILNSGTTVQLYKDPGLSALWAAGSGNVRVVGKLIFIIA